MEIAKFILTCISIVISIFAIIISINANRKSNETAKENTRIANGSLELQIREMISESRRYLTNAIHELVLIETDTTKSQNEELNNTINQQYESAKQDYLNSYEEACAKYIDKKVDTKRFKKTYYIEIQNIVTKEPFKSTFDSFSSTYTAIKRVYDEWFNLENEKETQ